jgi:tetratricopeptide (TPR) repeat protein
MPIMVYRLLPYGGMILAAVALKGLGALGRAYPGEGATERWPRVRLVLVNGLCVVLLALAALYAARDPRTRIGLGVTPRMFPEGAARFILSANAQGPLFNDPNLGNYLLWSLFPRHRVFAHAAFLDSVSDDRLIARAIDSAQDAEVFEGLVREYRVQLLVLRNNSSAWGIPTTPWPFVAGDPRWALVYWDDVASVYARRDGANAGLIAAHEFHATHFGYDLGYLDGVAHDPDAFRAAAAELRRALRADRENVGARISLAVLLKARGQDLEEALEALEVAQRQGLRHPSTLAWKAEILTRLGRRAAAEAAAREALRLDPANAAANFVLADLGARAGAGTGAERGPRADDPDGLHVIGP